MSNPATGDSPDRDLQWRWTGRSWTRRPQPEAETALLNGHPDHINNAAEAYIKNSTLKNILLLNNGVLVSPESEEIDDVTQRDKNAKARNA